MCRGSNEKTNTSEVCFPLLSVPAEEVIMKNNEIAFEVDVKNRNTFLTNGEWKFNYISVYHNIITGVEMNYSVVTYEV